MKIILLISLVCFADSKEKTLNIDPQFMEYVLLAKRLYREINGEPFILGKLTIRKAELFNKMMDTASDAVGECHEDRENPVINIGSWEHFGECQKEELITHEVGHCVFDMQHDLGGFMQPKLHSEKDCELNRTSLRKQFYKNAKNFRKWQKDKDKAHNEYKNAVREYLNSFESVEE
jgi:hypothetical protein